MLTDKDWTQEEEQEMRLRRSKKARRHSLRAPVVNTVEYCEGQTRPELKFLGWVNGGCSAFQTSHVSGAGKQKSIVVVCREQKRSRETASVDLLFEESGCKKRVRTQTVVRRGLRIKAIFSMGVGTRRDSPEEERLYCRGKRAVKEEVGDN